MALNSSCNDVATVPSPSLFLIPPPPLRHHHTPPRFPTAMISNSSQMPAPQYIWNQDGRP